MTTLVFNLFSHTRSLVVAPAGCGKTQTIVDAVQGHEGPPVLILTHTNAGVGALRMRLKAALVPRSRFRVATLDGWALRLIGAFPILSGLVLDRAGTIDYPQVRRAALHAIRSGGLDLPLKATYARLVVDEHQDCSCDQHALAVALADLLPTNVLGDPLQRIFDFRRGDLPDWAAVGVNFPVVATFDTPWRWINAGEAKFGAWVLEAREALLAGRPIDLMAAPANVRWVGKGTGRPDQAQIERDAVAKVRPDNGHGLLVIGNSLDRASRSVFARGAPGMTVVEPVDLNDMISAAREIEATAGGARFRKALDFACETMTGVDLTALTDRLRSLDNGTARTPATAGEAACLAYVSDDGYASTAAMLEALPRDGRRVFRRQLHEGMIEALRRAASRPSQGLVEAAVAIREQYRAAGRPLPARAVGSTLLLKGLEAEHAVILDADAMNARHLYVAISRASRSLTIISSLPVLLKA